MIHLNIGSNLNSIHGSRFDNISIAIQLLIEAKIQIEKISNFYETPSYPNQKLPKNPVATNHKPKKKVLTTPRKMEEIQKKLNKT